jgi:ElaB/YqjD/DUF883 family membrane-anchored ribosome-binding protein
MTEATSPIDREPETLPAGLDEPKASLADKLGTLEEGIKDTWHSATAAATRAAASVKEAAVTTAQAVRGAAHNTSEAVGRALDLPAHTRRHPWVLIGGALFLGLAAGYLVGRLRR